METRNDQEVYTKHYRNQEITHEKVFQSEYLLPKISEFFNKKDKVLEFGCGIGIFGKKVKEKFGSEFYGCDLNSVAIDTAKRNGLIAKKIDLEKKWPYQSNFFDVVIGVQTIEHILDTDFVIKEAKRVLKKDGYLIITTPNLNFWLNRIIFLFGYQPFFTEVSNKDKTFGLTFTKKFTSNREPLGHIRVFSLKALLDMLKFYSFKTVEVKGGYVNYFPKFLNFFDRFFSLFPGLATDIIVIVKK